MQKVKSFPFFATLFARKRRFMTCLRTAGMPAFASATEAITIYPSMIARAITMLDEDVFLRSLPRTVWGVLFRLIKKINVNELQKPIFASRETLAREAGESVSNLARQLRTLEEEGVITRSQKARSGMKGSSSEIIFTNKAIRALRLDLPPPGELKQTIKKRTIDTNGGVRYEETGLIRCGSFRIPSDLMKLIEEGGLKDRAVLRLMTIAKRAGQRLSDVIEALGDRISGLMGRQLFAYLNRACNGYRNFSVEKAATEKMEIERKKREKSEEDHRRAVEAEEKLERDAQAKKSKIIKGLSNEGVERLRKLWISTRKEPQEEKGRVGELIFMIWLRGQSESTLLGNVDNFIHTSYQK